MSTVQDLKQRRASLVQQITELDAVLRQLGASGPARARSRGATPAQLAGLAKARAAREAKLKGAVAPAPKPKPKRTAKASVTRPKSPLQAARERRAPLQQVSRPASLAAAAEG